MRKMRWIMVGLVVISLITMMACGDKEEHIKEAQSNVIRIYDVEPQDREECNNVQHYVRLGVVKNIADADGAFGTQAQQAPFANQMKKIAEASGAEIEYIVVGSWEELREEQEKYVDDNVTEMILFNNSYDKSLIKEANSGLYADMATALEEYGFYEEDVYEQTLLQTGVTEKGQILVPILYNVSGMIRGEKGRIELEEWKEQAYEQAKDANISYDEMIMMLEDAMVAADTETMDVPYMSVGFLEGSIDLYLTASGQKWESYKSQAELFELLHHYLTIYKETQANVGEEEVPLQELYGKYLSQYDDVTLFNMEKNVSERDEQLLPDQLIMELGLEEYEAEEQTASIDKLFLSLLERTQYFVETSSAEEVAYHSVFGTLMYQKYFVERGSIVDFLTVSQLGGTMDYWPIGVMGSEEEYAAQPICYAAVVKGGNTRLAAKVIQAMMQQEIDPMYGISVNHATKEWQLENWIMGANQIGYVRYIHYNKEDNVWTETIERAGWYPSMIGNSLPITEHREVYTEQVREQLDNIVVAQIPDREILAIWQDTLTESVESGLSAQAGFEMLCQRMDEWYKE